MLYLYIALIIYFYTHLFLFLTNLYDICAQPVSKKYSQMFRYVATIDELLVTTITFFLIVAIRNTL